MKIRYLKSAKQDIKMGFSFYESQEPGLGAYFLESIYSDIDSLLIFGGIHPVRFGSYYRMLSKRFPWTIYYRIHNNEIRIYAVIDCRRNPRTIENKLK